MKERKVNDMKERLVELLSTIPFGVNHMILLDRVQPETINAIADGLLAADVIVPPCKMGTRLYAIITRRPTVTRHIMTTQEPRPDAPHISYIKPIQLTYRNLERVVREYGKTMFLTRAEADTALNALKQGKK